MILRCIGVGVYTELLRLRGTVGLESMSEGLAIRFCGRALVLNGLAVSVAIVTGLDGKRRASAESLCSRDASRRCIDAPATGEGVWCRSLRLDDPHSGCLSGPV